MKRTKILITLIGGHIQTERYKKNIIECKKIIKTGNYRIMYKEFTIILEYIKHWFKVEYKYGLFDKQSKWVGREQKNSLTRGHLPPSPHHETALLSFKVSIILS